MKKPERIKKKIDDMTITERKRICGREWDGESYRDDLAAWYCARCPLHVNVIDEVDKKWDWLCIRHLFQPDFEKRDVLMLIDKIAEYNHKTQEEVINLLKERLEKEIEIPKKRLTKEKLWRFYPF